jgi:hypothetical protein
MKEAEEYCWVITQAAGAVVCGVTHTYLIICMLNSDFHQTFGKATSAEILKCLYITYENNSCSVHAKQACWRVEIKIR